MFYKKNKRTKRLAYVCGYIGREGGMYEKKSPNRTLDIVPNLPLENHSYFITNLKKLYL